MWRQIPINYNTTVTSTYFRAYHNESDSATSLEYQGSKDQAQGTSYQTISESGPDNDQATSGTLILFNPSSTTFVKHYIARSLSYWDQHAPFDQYVAGYGNTTSAINAIKFQMSSGNIDAGQILLFGVN